MSTDGATGEAIGGETDGAMDAVFQALANPVRRQMLDLVRSEPGATVGRVCEPFAMSRIGAMKHLNMLESAGLIVSRQQGRSRLLYVNAVPIQMIYDRWISDWSSLWSHEMTTIKYRAEAAAAKSGTSKSGSAKSGTGKSGTQKPGIAKALSGQSTEPTSEETLSHG